MFRNSVIKVLCQYPPNKVPPCLQYIAKSLLTPVEHPILDLVPVCFNNKHHSSRF